MPTIYSDLPTPVMQALLEQTGFEIAGKETAQIHILAANLPPAPYRLADVIELANKQLKQLVVCGIEFNLAAKFAQKDDVKISLTEKEAAIILALSQSKQPLSREELLGKVWNYAKAATTNTVETHIYRLRQKLAESFGQEVILSKSSNYSLA